MFDKLPNNTAEERKEIANLISMISKVAWSDIVMPPVFVAASGNYRGDNFAYYTYMDAIISEDNIRRAFFRLLCLYIYGLKAGHFETLKIGGKGTDLLMSRIYSWQPNLFEEIKGLNKEQVRDLIVKETQRGNFPLQLFDPEECADIVLYEIENNTGALEKLYEAAEKRFQKKYKNQLKKTW